MVVMLLEGRGRFSKELGVGGLELFTVDGANSCPAYAATFGIWELSLAREMLFDQLGNGMY
jgi:hypothetical protein